VIKVAVIIVTYNAEKYLDGLFGSLGKMRIGGLDAQVIVVDNASKDGTVRRLKKERPEVRLIENDVNAGFAGGNDIGIAVAMDEGADYVYLLNHDTEVASDFLVEAVKVAEADEKIGAVQSLLLLWQDKERINSTGNAVHFLGFGYCLDYKKRVSDWKYAGIKEIAYASGAGVLYRASVLRVTGLLDEALFMYHEDLDLGWRIRLAGFRNVLAPHSVVYHKYEFSRSIAKFYYMERNRYVVLMKNLRLWTLLVLAPWLILSEAALFIAAARGGWWKEKLRVYAYFLLPSSWAHLARERARSTLIRQVGDREIVRLFTPTIRFQDVTGPFTRYVANPLMTVLWSLLRLVII
jgi:GT2 family glycosyltransferase